MKIFSESWIRKFFFNNDLHDQVESSLLSNGVGNSSRSYKDMSLTSQIDMDYNVNFCSLTASPVFSAIGPVEGKTTTLAVKNNGTATITPSFLGMVMSPSDTGTEVIPGTANTYKISCDESNTYVTLLNSNLALPWPSGADGDLIVLPGETVTLSDSEYDYSSIRVDAGGTLIINNDNFDITEIYSKNTEINGTVAVVSGVIASSITKNGTTRDGVPYTYSYSPKMSGDGGHYQNSQGGATKGYGNYLGGGGGAGGSIDTSYKGGNGGSAGGNGENGAVQNQGCSAGNGSSIGGSGSTGSPGSNGNPGGEFFITWTGGIVYYNPGHGYSGGGAPSGYVVDASKTGCSGSGAGGGGGGGWTGESGGALYLYSKNSISGTGSLTASGQNGGNGGDGNSGGGGIEYGGGGGGGAGGSGGHVIIKSPGHSINVSVSSGSGGSGGLGNELVGYAGSGQNGDIGTYQNLIA